jgi:hypothetical protein
LTDEGIGGGIGRPDSSEPPARHTSFSAPDLQRPDVWDSVTDPLREQHPVVDATLAFIRSITSMRNVVLPYITQADEALVFAEIQFKDIRASAPQLEAPLHVPSHPMPIEKQTPYLKAERNYYDAIYGARNLPRLYLLGLVSEYDAFLAQLMAALMTIKPELVGRIAKQLSMSDLEPLTSINEAKHLLVEKEIEYSLRQSHADQLKWFEELKVDRRHLGPYADFIEVMERRNLVAHNGARVTNRYIQLTSTRSTTLAPENLTVGQELPLTTEYLLRATDVLFEVAVRLAQISWRSVKASEFRPADVSLSRIIYVLLVFEEYALARDLLTFAVHDIKKHSSEHERLIFVVNLAQAHKWLGNEDACEKILEDVDWTACEPAFRLSRHALLDDFEEAAKLMRVVVQNGDETEENFRDWPVYRGFRRTELFKEVFRELFHKEPPPA